MDIYIYIYSVFADWEEILTDSILIHNLPTAGGEKLNLTTMVGVIAVFASSSLGWLECRSNLSRLLNTLLYFKRSY